ncbi:restriction endonuclease subunit S [Mycolicibacterium llatzerense]|uniref:restriction endonuclease subunit S n=1 Tax=Mycolicibacterium llatzerense TaxID=280871 RepID=UPI0021B5E24B|nr:restriction endonuclease subunit S [Mycolicibacterium llatzerense]
MTWPTAALGDVATLQRGFDLPVQDRLPGNIPIFAANGPVGFHETAQVGGPGVVTGRSGSIGKVHYVEGDFWPLNTSLYVRDFHGNHPKYVYWLLRELRLERFSTGTGVPTLNRNVIHELHVPLPPFAEQHRVAAILDHADRLRSTRRNCLAKFDKLAKSLFNDAFGDPVANQPGLPVRLLQEWIDPARPITYGILKPGPEVDGGVPYIRVADMKNGGIEEESVRRTSHEISNQYKRSRLQTGDLLMSIRGHVGRFAFIPESLAGANITQDSARLAITEPASATYVRAAMEMPSLQHWMARRTKGAAVQGINLGDLKEAPIPLPSLAQQQQFAAKLQAVRTSMSLSERQLQLADSAFASLQSRIFRGEL